MINETASLKLQYDDEGSSIKTPSSPLINLKCLLAKLYDSTPLMTKLLVFQ